MSITFDPAHRTFTLSTEHTMYQMQIGPMDYLLHLYYGPRAEGCFDYLYLPWDCGFSANPYELAPERGWSLDNQPQEYSGANCGDFRLRSLDLTTEAGVSGADLRYVRHEIAPGKYSLNGLPAAFARDGEAETLVVTLADAAASVEVQLLYGVYPAKDVITRSARIVNNGGVSIRLEKAASVCLDLRYGDWDMIHFHGRHAMERGEERMPVMTGIQSVGSRRGFSSHQQNPFVILCDKKATEDAGNCYGVMLAYSGSSCTEIEKDQTGNVRVVSGIREEQFSWLLRAGESFDTPETILTYSRDGLTALSHTYHRFIRENICRGRFALAQRPVLLNNWEATYFDFTAEKLLGIAKEAKELGVDLFVLDDGWFGDRKDDYRALGDWFPNTKKLPEGLGALIRQVKDLGLKFGLWMEPEMVSEDSELYRAHPDWAFAVPGRKPTLGRSQMVLDLSRAEVVDWLFETIAGLLREHDIDYIKWDANRNLTDLYSAALPADRQGELLHRYVLGLYSLLDRLTTAFPDVLFEGCAGGGGRFDAGMLAYCPQIWCSDNTDPIERLEIQRGTSFGYPVSAMGAHVSASPNHQTGRATPLALRGMVAMSGTFGCELDPGKLSAEEKAEIREQIRFFRAHYDLIQRGDYYRLSDPSEESDFARWQFVSRDRGEALLNLAATHVRGNPAPAHLWLKGLDPEARYELSGFRCFDILGRTAKYLETMKGKRWTGAALMYGGFTFPALYGDYPCVQLCFRRL